MRKSRPTLSRRLSLSIILLATPLFVITLGTFTRHVQDLLHQESLQRTNSILNTTLQRVVNFLSTIETAAQTNAWLLEEHFTPDSLEEISNRILRLNASVMSSSIGVEPNAFPQCGRYFSVYSVNDDDTIYTNREPEYEYFERAWYRTPVLTGNPCWVTPFTDFNQGNINYTDAVASYCVPLRPDGRHIKGVVSADFAFSKLAEAVLSAEHPFPSAYYMLIGSDGRYLIHPQTNRLFRKTIFSDTDSIQHPDVFALGHAMTTGQRGIMHVNMDHTLFHVCYAPVPGTDWSLALMSPDKEVLSDYNHLTHIIIVVIAIGLLLILWLTARVVKRNIKPINQLLEVTQKIADGNYDEPIPHATGKDIVSLLQNAFAAMQHAILAHNAAIDNTTAQISRENEELEKVTQQAEASTARKHMFIASVLRQIRTPLNAVERLTDTLVASIASRETSPDKQDTLQGAELTNITTTMKSNASQLIRMVVMLYDMSGKRSDDDTLYKIIDEVSCSELAQECVDFVKENYTNAVVTITSSLPYDIRIHTNHLYLMRTVRELLYNAAKYSDAKHIQLKVEQTATTVRFIVEDNGPGIAPETLPQMFQPFEKFEDNADGLGLGLALCKRHAQGLGGDLTFDATYTQGCRFIVDIPKH